VSRLTKAEAARYAEAQEHIRAQLAMDITCLWEMPKPRGTNYAMIAGFACMFDGAPHLFILQIYGRGSGWEIFAAPHSVKIGETLQAVKAMWRAPEPAAAQPSPAAVALLRRCLAAFNWLPSRLTSAGGRETTYDLAAAISAFLRPLDAAPNGPGA
jgi:hypothetical protein